LLLLRCRAYIAQTTTLQNQHPSDTAAPLLPTASAPSRRPTRRHTVLKIAPTSFFADYGCHVRIYEETRVLRNLGHRVVICTYHTGREIDGLDIRRALNTPWQKTVRVGSNMHKLYQDGLLALKVAQVAAQVRPSVIHAHLHEGALIGYPVSRALQVPLVFDYQGSLTSEMLDHKFLRQDSILYRPLRFLEQRINHMADIIVTSSQNAADVLRNEFSYPLHKVVTLSDSVDTTVFLPREQLPDPQAPLRLKHALGIPADRVLIVYLGLLAQYQGTDHILEAASLIVQKGLPVHFLIMGFPGEDAYRAQASALGLGQHVTFTGRIPYDEAPLYLATGDIATSPKLSETEGNGKLLNYMAVGLPTVAFRTPVAEEILGELGNYATPGDSASLARAMEELVTDQALRREKSCRLRDRAVERFSWYAAGQQLELLYNTLSKQN